jgi:hypothetical protein
MENDRPWRSRSWRAAGGPGTWRSRPRQAAGSMAGRQGPGSRVQVQRAGDGPAGGGGGRAARAGRGRGATEAPGGWAANVLDLSENESTRPRVE